MPLETFPARSRLKCCGTCREWGLMHYSHGAVPWCPEMKRNLPDDLTACGCEAWEQEPRETHALDLYDALSKAGAA